MVEIVLLGYIVLRFILRIDLTGRRRRKW